MPEYLAPGVYVEETSFRAKAIEGVSTTTAAFIGPTRYGPDAIVPPLLTSLGEFERIYGDGRPLAFAGQPGKRDNHTWHAVRAFFANGGKRLHVARVLDPGATRARSADNTLCARFPGAAGNGRVVFAALPGPNLMAVPGVLPATVSPGDIVQVNGERDAAQKPVWRRVTAGTPQTFVALRGAHPAIALSPAVTGIACAQSISVGFIPFRARTPRVILDGLEADVAAVARHFPAAAAGDAQACFLPIVVENIADATLHDGIVRLSGGSDGSMPSASLYAGTTAAEGVGTGLKVFEAIDDIAIVAAPALAALAPDEARAGVALLQEHVERMRYRMAVIDCGQGQSLAEVRVFRAGFDSKHMAFYYPWLRVRDPIARKEILLPPSGFVAGIYVRNDTERGVWKAPANEVVNGAIGPERLLGQAEQEVLNPEGINCFRVFEGCGLRLWGARTLSTDPEWKYVNVRRYLAYLERSIDRGTQWVVFERNDATLWANVRGTIEDFLFNEWRMGALLGDKPEKGFLVRCDRTTMTQDDLDNGRLICLVGVAPLKPAEFITFRIGQKTADA